MQNPNVPMHPIRTTPAAREEAQVIGLNRPVTEQPKTHTNRFNSMMSAKKASDTL